MNETMNETMKNLTFVFYLILCYFIVFKPKTVKSIAERLYDSFISNDKKKSSEEMLSIKENEVLFLKSDIDNLKIENDYLKKIITELEKRVENQSITITYNLRK